MIRTSLGLILPWTFISGPFRAFFRTYQTFWVSSQDLIRQKHTYLRTLCIVKCLTAIYLSFLFSKVQRLSPPLHFTFVTKRAVITKAEAALNLSTKERKKKINCMFVEIPVSFNCFDCFGRGDTVKNDKQD